MMAAEFAQFETAIRRLEKLFSKKIDDDTMQAYWRSLKDLALPVFIRFVERHEKYGKFFPKPSELRAKEDKLPPVAGNDADFKAAEMRCIIHLEQLRKTNLEEWLRQMGSRRAATYVNQFGNENVFFDTREMCWRTTT